MRRDPEFRYSEKPAIELLRKMDYDYFDAAQTDPRASIHEVLLEDRLRAAIRRLNPQLDDNNLQKAFYKITSVSGNSLIEINQNIHELLRGGSYSLKQVINGKEVFPPVHFIDYDNPTNNDFLVINQMKFHGKLKNSIPDLVIYVNGMPLAVIECKAPGVVGAWEKAFGDLKYYQENSEKLFQFNQICAGIWQVGGKYGAINAPEQFYSFFRTKDNTALEALTGEKPQPQDVLLFNLFEPSRFLDILRHFVIFELEEGRIIKKLPRYQQIRATNQTIARLQEGKGGVVWHTQGSGKSITMAYVTRKLQAEAYGFDNPTVVVMTDRKDLDRQISGTFRNVGFKNVNQASSVVHLDRLLRNDYGGIITTTIQKFQESDNESDDQKDESEIAEDEKIRVEKSIKGKLLTKITKRLERGKWKEIERVEIELEELSQKKNLYILVDEAHRSHYGFLAAFMRSALPHAKFIAFTGTPISKEDKSTLGEFYGGDYIDVYTIKESVADGATVELKYDEGIAKLDVKKEALDLEFEEKFGHHSAEKKDKLKRDAIRKYQLSRKRVEEVARHILNHYSEKIYKDGHKAMLVCDGRAATIRYQEAFEKLRSKGVHDFKSKVIISVGSPKTDAIAKAYYERLDWNKNNPNDPKPLLLTPPEQTKAASIDFKLPFGNESEMDKSGKRKKYDNTAFLIVSDMLLTGYDAPIASCLYLDKPLKEHNLLQAIARVNRSRSGKSAGFVMDYIGITEHLIEALEIFSGDLRPDDILKNINEEIPKLQLNHSILLDSFKSIKPHRVYERDKWFDEALRYLEPQDLRDEFKDHLKKFNKSLNIVLPNPAGIQFEGDFKLFNELKIRARNFFPEDEDLKTTKEESQMLQSMIDEHLEANGVVNLFTEPVSIIDKDKFEEELLNASPKSKELKMRKNLKYTIQVGLDKNPDYYKPLAQRLEELLRIKEEKRLDDAQLLIKYNELQEDIINEQKEGKEKGFTTEREIAVYNSMKTVFDEDAERAARAIFEQVKGELGIIEWENKGSVKKEMEKKIRNILLVKLDRDAAKLKAKQLVELIKKNK